MRNELFETGKSVDAAIDSACEKLGCSREDCEWEIIDLPKKGFLGLKNTPAKVRVSIEIPEEKQTPPAVQRPAVRQEVRPASVPAHTPAPKIEPQPTQADTRAEFKPRVENKPQPRVFEEKRAKPLSPTEISEKETIAKNYLAEIINASGLKADFVVTHEHGGSSINIVGEGLGMIIGRRGETLDAIQYLTGLVANRGEGEYLRLTVDCGDYRLKRKDTLESLAKKLASQVIKTNVSKTLEPMNPFERRIIHATVSEIEGVSSASVGEEPNRRVVITSPTARPTPRNNFRPGLRETERPPIERSGGFNKSRPPRRDIATPAEGQRIVTASNAFDKTTVENTATNFVPRPPRPEGARDNDNRGDKAGFNRNRPRDDRRGPRDGDRRPPRQVQQTPVGTPKKTPEAEATSGISFGKIDLE